nr:cleavage stimulation factor subunit 3-like [Lytechinus pictus]
MSVHFDIGTNLEKPTDLNQSNKVFAISVNPVSSEQSQGTEEGGERQERANKEEIFRPSLDQMLPFRPRVAPLPGAHPVPGGDFPLPLAASMVLTKLPPPQSFQGPFVKVDDLIRLIAECRLPEPSHEPVPLPNGMEQEDSQGRWRTENISEAWWLESQPEEDSMTKSLRSMPRHDMRSRQQKRVK